MRVFLLILAVAWTTGCGASSPPSVVVTSDIDRFWEAYDKIVATDDGVTQRELLDSLYIDRGTPGLAAIVERRGYTTGSYVEAINSYPEFWASIRPNTLRTGEFSAELDEAVSTQQGPRSRHT